MLIDHLLSSGADGRATARRFDLGKDSVYRHFRDHVSEAFKGSVRAGPFGSEENLRKLVAAGQVNDLETLDAYRAIIGSRLVANVEVGADKDVAALLKAGHENVALRAKITGGLAPTRSEVTVNVLQDPRTVRLVTMLMAIPREFPETRARITEIVRMAFGAPEEPALIDATPEVCDAA